MKLNTALEKQVSAALLRIGARSPYFATLAMHARYEQSEAIGTAATDGRTIFINKTFWDQWTTPQQDGLLLHEVLHAALLHVSRRGGREGALWNIAADAVINGMIVREGYALPEGGVRRPDLEHLSTEEAYEKLVRETQANPQPASMPTEPTEANKGIGADLLSQAPSDASKDPAAGPPKPGAVAADDDQWRQALEQAEMVARTSAAGTQPRGMQRELGQTSPSRVDWRSYLWRYLTHMPTDFNAFDRRFIGRGIYLDEIAGESVRVLVAVDTSGSINHADIGLFLGELQGILSSYPQMLCELFYADTKLHGPYLIKPHAPLPAPIGGGGTDFRPFFAHIATHPFTFSKTVAIYLTDGHGSFPDPAPKVPTLWVVTPGGLDLDKLPFGERVRLLPSA